MSIEELTDEKKIQEENHKTSLDMIRLQFYEKMAQKDLRISILENNLKI
jgi:hypothetical protein